jgi:hypothetical protein
LRDQVERHRPQQQQENQLREITETAIF